MADQDRADNVKQLQQAADGSFIVSMVGGGEIRFHVSGGITSVKIEIATPRSRGIFDDDEPRIPRATLSMPAVVPEPAPKPKQPEPKEVSGPLLWIRSQQKSDPDHRAARPWLVEAEGLRVGLLPGYTYAVGRDDKSDIRIVEAAVKGDTVSRKHASLGVIGGGLYVIDDDSRNGTFVGGDRIAARAAIVLRRRTDLSFGKFALVVRPAPDDLKVP